MNKTCEECTCIEVRLEEKRSTYISFHLETNLIELVFMDILLFWGFNKYVNGMKTS
jgi:hypothetical protein